MDKGQTRDVLLAIAAVGAAFVMPGAARAIYSLVAKRIAGQDTPEERALKARKLKELAGRRLITIRDVSGDKVEVTLTSAGKKLVKLYKLDDMKLPKPPKWDKKWRVITYDISAKHRRASVALSCKFHDLGMFRLQKNIWVYPHECKDDIDSIFAIFGLNPDSSLLYLLSDRLPRESEVRRHFDMALA